MNKYSLEVEYFQLIYQSIEKKTNNIFKFYINKIE